MPSPLSLRFFNAILVCFWYVFNTHILSSIVAICVVVVFVVVAPTAAVVVVDVVLVVFEFPLFKVKCSTIKKKH